MTTETSFSEFVEFVDMHPKWRRKLVKVLFPSLDIAKAFHDLEESQQQMQWALQKLTRRVGHIEEDVAVLKEDVAILKEDVAVLKEDVAVLKEDVAVLKEDVATLKDRVERGFAEAAAERAEMKRDITYIKKDVTRLSREVAQVKGFNYESRIVQHAASIFGKFMRRGHDARHEIGLLLEEAEDNDIITEQEHDHVLALDLLWGGKQKGTKANIVLAIEVSWRAEETDIKRAMNRAETLRKMGLTALPVVAGLEWDEAMTNLANQHKVVFLTNKTVDKTSWQNAFRL